MIVSMCQRLEGAYLTKIREELEMPDKKYLNCHGFQIFNSKVLDSLKDFIYKKYDGGYIELMTLAPLEFSWYNYYLQKTNLIQKFYSRFSLATDKLIGY